MAGKQEEVREDGVKTVSQSEARNRFASIVRTAMQGTPILVEHRGNPTVMIVSAAEHARRVTGVRPELADELRNQFLGENEASMVEGAEDAVEAALFSGSLRAKITE